MSDSSPKSKSRGLLLSMHPHLFIPDLPRTFVRHGKEIEAVAQAVGLTYVRAGRQHLFSRLLSQLGEMGQERAYPRPGESCRALGSELVECTWRLPSLCR